MRHENLTVTESLIAVYDFLIALGYNVKELRVDEAITLKRNLFAVIKESGLEDKLQKPDADKITDKF